MRHGRGVVSLWRTIILTGVVLLAMASLGAAIAAQERDRLTIPLREYDDSGVSGTATLEAVDDGVHVSMELSGASLTGNHPAHIHTGTCANFDPNPTYPLKTVILENVGGNGRSETTVEGVRLRDLLRGDYVILVHKSAQDLTNYLVCGDITMSASVNQPPVAGVGSIDAGVAPAAPAAALALLVALLAMAIRFAPWPRGTRAG